MCRDIGEPCYFLAFVIIIVYLISINPEFINNFINLEEIDYIVNPTIKSIAWEIIISCWNVYETSDIRFSFLIGSDRFIKDSRAYLLPSGWFPKTNLIRPKGCVKNKLLPPLEKKLFLQSRPMSIRGWDFEIFCGFARSNIKTSPQLLCTSSTRKVIHTSQAVSLWKIHDETFWRKKIAQIISRIRERECQEYNILNVWRVWFFLFDLLWNWMKGDTAFLNADDWCFQGTLH